MHWLYSEPAVFLGFMAFQGHDYRLAQRYYSIASALAERLVGLAGDYRALPGVADSFRRSSAEDVSQLGVISERLGDIQGAKALYLKAMGIYPLAQAHYNYAVLSWGKDWGLVESELAETLRLDPGNAEAAKYLAAARARKR